MLFMLSMKGQKVDRCRVRTHSCNINSFDSAPFIDRQRLADGAVGGRSVQIKVADNGGGIPQNIVDKIFQPFFTTKANRTGNRLGFIVELMILLKHMVVK